MKNSAASKSAHEALNGFTIRLMNIEKKVGDKRNFSDLAAEDAMHDLACACDEELTQNNVVLPADHPLAAALYDLTERAIAAHGTGDVAWEFYCDVCKVLPTATALWRDYPEKFVLADTSAIDAIDQLTPPEIANRDVLSKSGRTFIGRPSGHSHMYPIAQYITKKAPIKFRIEDEVGDRKKMEKRLAIDYAAEPYMGLKIFTENMAARTTYALFMDAAAEHFEKVIPRPLKPKSNITIEKN